MSDPKLLDGTATGYLAGLRTVQVDAVVYNKKTGHLSAYEIKRGAGKHDAGKQRQILRDTLCVQVLLKSYGEQRGLKVNSSSSHVIFYYGLCSLPRQYRITRDDMDAHFGWEVAAPVEAVNKYYQERLFSILSS